VLHGAPDILGPLLGNKVDLTFAGAQFQLVPPVHPESRHHVILNLVAGSGLHGRVSERDLVEGAGLAMIIARKLSSFLHGDEHHYTISKNGSATGSVPEIEHWHIYAFRDREDKIETWLRNVSGYTRRTPLSSDET
jgi:hypothetical protein